jgi:2-methylisocitrate lyase-like PEP mutase family enzyme/predicted thioesterase
MAKGIPIGASGEAHETVAFEHTLTTHNPALPLVYSTPDMIRLMETAAFFALQPYCEDGEITVGTAIDIQHRAASGIGARITAKAALESFDGRFYTLRVSATDKVREIGRGTVGRAVVNVGKFTEKTETNGLEQRRRNLAAKAEAFRALHVAREVLLPNVWDVASARIIEEAGFSALATTSAGIAFSLGYPDGQKISRDEMLAVVARIAKAVKVPVTADVEAGYGSRPEDAARTAGEVIGAGAVGMNLEDASDDPEHPLVDLPLQLEKIRAIRETAKKLAVPIVLNARTDVYLLQVGDPSKHYDEAVRRLSAYRDAGADCVFLPGMRDKGTIARLVADLKCPVNILAGPGSPSVPELRALGVARISLGSSAMRATLGYLRRIAEELKSTGTYATLEGAPPHAEMNRLMEDRSIEN